MKTIKWNHQVMGDTGSQLATLVTPKSFQYRDFLRYKSIVSQSDPKSIPTPQSFVNTLGYSHKLTTSTIVEMEISGWCLNTVFMPIFHCLGHRKILCMLKKMRNIKPFTKPLSTNVFWFQDMLESTLEGVSNQ